MTTKSEKLKNLYPEDVLEYGDQLTEKEVNLS